MILVAMDTATPSTVAGVLLPDGRVVEARDDPPEGSRGQHASRLLLLVERALAEGGVTWEDVERIAVGVGPGGFTGLRIGIATARALAQARGLPLVPVSSLAALAAGAAPAPAVAAVLDARRGEVFAGVWAGERELLAPAALAPEALAERLRALELPVQAVGDGAVRFRAELEGAGVAVPIDGSAVHRIAAAPLCRLGAAGEPAERDRLLPDYRREPDAKPPQ
ncbi:MAG TPA: tRNA (adenosine(37)-N6)-threonylcarbamoyltransferase complex dimerization subunit type 1 TsaB [Solirubrobacteraceae bacterium]|nr:tRNA (adenosine(37)-N6)-threonylcarbamoyltransferase complex dimerization subunit type 1 TsaB [Solirubrobacteraceae bacterium]